MQNNKKKIKTSYSKKIFMTEILSKQPSNVLLVKEENQLEWNEILKKFKINDVTGSEY